MIKQVNEAITTVQFGSGELGSIGLIGSRGRLIMQDLISEIQIGCAFDMKNDVNELPKVILNFTETSSIDSLIKVLQKVKEKMIEPEYPAWAYAC